MSRNVKNLPEALEDLRKLDGSQKILIRKAIQNVCQNPLPENEAFPDAPAVSTFVTKQDFITNEVIYLPYPAEPINIFPLPVTYQLLNLSC